MKIFSFIVFVLILVIHPCSGNDFKYLRTNEGLNNGEINSIAQDKSGRMWFATWTGLICYNGYSFQFFLPELGNDRSLPNKKVSKVFISSQDVLWVSTGVGISYFKKDDQTFHPVSFGDNYPKDIYTYNFFESKGHVIIHSNFGLFLVYQSGDSTSEYRMKKLKIRDEKIEFVDFIHSMCTFNDELALVSNGYSTVPDRVLLAEIAFEKNDTIIKIRNQVSYKKHINAIAWVKDGNSLFLAATDGVSVLNVEKLSITDQVYFKGLSLRNMVYASNGRLYCYSDNPVLYYVDLKSSQEGKYLPDPMIFGSLLDNNIMCLFEDFSGNLWIGHQGLGLSILNLNPKAFYSFKRNPSDEKSLSGNIVMCFNGTNKEIFVGLRQGGINITSKQLSKNGDSEFRVLCYQQQPQPLSDFDNIWNIARESDSVFYVASNGGLARLVKTNKGWLYGNKNEEPLYRGVIRKIMIDQDKNIWCGTFDDGLVFFPALKKNPGRKYYHYHFMPGDTESISDKTVLSMLVDSKNHFWIGTNNGLNLVDKLYNQLDLSGQTMPDIHFSKFIATKPEHDFLNANEINCIFEDENKKIWLATQNGGINILDVETMKFSHLTTDNGLPGNDVLGILPDKTGVKWVSTNKGIVAIDDANSKKPYTYYSISDGLQGETFKVNSYYKADDGELFLGGDNGFTRFFPEQIIHNPIPPRIGLTFLRIMNKVVNIGDTISNGNIMSKTLDETNSIVLPFNKNSFSIGVGVHHYQYPGGNLIRYMLEGFTDKWITLPATNEFIYFSKLPFGNYTFHISALSADNVEAVSERILEIEILPPWYHTWYARTVFLILILTGLAFILNWFNRQQKLAFQKKLDLIAIENNENKMRFLTNIAHELRTPLSLVIAPIEDMKKNYTTIDAKWKEYLDLIYRNSNYLMTLINQIIDFRKLNSGKLQLILQNTDVVLLVKEVVSNFKGLESRRKTNLQIEVPEASVLIKIDRQKIEEVIYNLLSNAFKHTNETHLIKVSLKVISGEENNGMSDQVRITVFNEGKDISDEDKVKIFERFYKVNENVEGAGIGLSFSKSLVEMHHGTISVESVVGAGVAFHVNLPAEELQVIYAGSGQEKSEIVTRDEFSAPQNGHEFEMGDKELTIVVVEDNADLRIFLKNTLSENYHCIEAEDGKEGYELINKVIPDIVISDVVMPKMDGYELCEKIKENGKTCHIPIILLTANNTSDHIVSGYDKGADAYVTKPFDMSIIRAQISRLIKNRELIREKYLTQNFMVEVSHSNFSKDDEFIARLRKLLEDNLSESDFNVKKLSEDLNISNTHLYRKLKALTGLSPIEFLRTFKLQKACEMLSNSNYSIKEIGYGLGFNNLSYFVKCFREQFGVTPSVYRQKGLPDQKKIIAQINQEYHKLTSFNTSGPFRTLW